MTVRDALGLACVLFPSLRVPVAFVDLVGELAGRVYVDEAGHLHLGENVTVIGGADRRRWALGTFVEVSPWEATASVALGPLNVCAIVDHGDAPLEDLLPSAWEVAA